MHTFFLQIEGFTEICCNNICIEKVVTIVLCLTLEFVNGNYLIDKILVSIGLKIMN